MSLLSEIAGLLTDDDLGVRTEVIYLLYLKAGKNGLKLLEEYLNHNDPRLQTAAVACMAEHQLLEARELLDEDRLETFLVRTDADAETGRIEVARLLGLLEGDHYRVFLAQLMADRSLAVVQAAIASCGRRRDPDFVEPLIDRLASYSNRAAAKDALAAYGKSILPLLSERLLTAATPPSIRRNLPGVMWRIRDSESVQALIRSVRSTPPSLRFFVVKALNKLHRAVPGLRFDTRSVHALIVAEIEDFERNRQNLLAVAAATRTPAGELLVRALRERCSLSLELVFRLLGLVHPTPDMRGAYLGIVGDRPTLRSSASEYLDNYLQGELRWRILLVIEQWTEIRRLDKKADPPQDGSGIESVCRELLTRDDPWLQALALANLANALPLKIAAVALSFAEHPDPFLRETARSLSNPGPAAGQ